MQNDWKNQPTNNGGGDTRARDRERDQENMIRRCNIIIPVIATLVLLVVPSVAWSSPSYAQLAAQNRALRVQHARDQARIVFYQDRIVTIAGERNTALRQRNQALAGLPDAIRAAPLDQFEQLVLIPALNTWMCDDLYTSGIQWTYTFYNYGCG